MDGDFDNVLLTPDDSPVNSPKGTLGEKESGGRYVHMAQQYEAVHRSQKANITEKGKEEMNFPPIVKIDLNEEDRMKMSQTMRLKKNQGVRASTLTERIHVDQHPLASSQTIKSSVIDWVATFQNLPKFPATISEFITSGTLYMIMEEIEPEYFKELSYSLLPKQEGRAVLSDFDLRKIYKHMMLQMELWFLQNGQDTVKKNFRKELVDVNRLIDY